MSPLQQVSAAFAVAVLLFLATNVDDIFLLLALFANPSFRPAQIVLGQVLGMAVLLALSLAGSLAAVAVAPRFVALLGLLPLCLGILQLVRTREPEADRESSSPQAVLSVLFITVANGGDNLGVYIPLFASASRAELAVYMSVMLALALVWCWLAHRLITNPRLGGPIRRYLAPATPFVLIALGLYILLKPQL